MIDETPDEWFFRKHLKTKKGLEFQDYIAWSISALIEIAFKQEKEIELLKKQLAGIKKGLKK